MHIMPGVGQLIDKVEPFKPTGLKYNSPDGSDSFKQVLQTVSDELVAPTNPAGATVQLANQAAVYPELTVVDANVSSLKSQNWLMDRHHAGSINKPNIRELMDATGAEFSDASELLYGVIGSNADRRNWTKIMMSDKPVEAIKAATDLQNIETKSFSQILKTPAGGPTTPTSQGRSLAPLPNLGEVDPAFEVGETNFSSLKSQNWLLGTQHAASTNKPNIREFMNSTGAEYPDASELLYGVIGSNADLRDWTKINASDNPVDAARAATNQLYNSDKNYAMVNHADYGTPKYDAILADSSLSTKTVISQAGNFAEIKIDTGATETMAVSSTGLLLRGAGSTQVQIERTAWLFGFNTKALFV